MCNCIDEIDAKLKEMTPDNNTKLDIPITLSGIERVRIGVAKRDEKNRKKPTIIFPAYCPFCGVEYSSKKEEKEKK